MAANFWKSSHRKEWIEEEETIEERKGRRVRGEEGVVDGEGEEVLHIYFARKIEDIGKRMGLPQSVIGSGIVFFRRYYTVRSMEEKTPFVVMPTALFLAGKVDDFPRSLDKMVKTTVASLTTSFGRIDLTPEAIKEAEFDLMATLEYSLLVFHPYAPLQDYLADAGLSHELLETAWYIVNDTYRTPLPLSYPPYMLALTAVYMAAAMNDVSVADWFGSMLVDINEIHDIAARMVRLYNLWSSPSYNEQLQRAKRAIFSLHHSTAGTTTAGATTTAGTTTSTTSTSTATASSSAAK